MGLIKKWMRPLGYLVSAAALLYLGRIVLHSDLNALQLQHPLRSLGFILLFGVWASLFVIIGAYNWKLILEFVNQTSLSAKEVFPVYLKSNVAKYFPGNIMHYAGRNYLGGKLGWKQSEIALSSLLEYIFGFGLTGLTIIIFMVAGLINIPPQVPLKIDFTRLLIYSTTGTAAALILTYACRYLFGREGFGITTGKIMSKARQFCTVRFFILFARMSLISLVCFLLNCLFYFYLCYLVLDFEIRPADFFNANAALSIGNYMSIVTPGVPGGIGVKESVSVLLISAYGYPKEPLVMSLVVFRLVCVLGDLLPYLFIVFRRNGSMPEVCGVAED